MRRFGFPLLIVAVVAALIGIFALGNGGDKSKDNKPTTYATRATADGLPGLLTTEGPWDNNGAKLKERLDAIGLPALAQEALAFHIHQHLDIYVHGQKFDVPANIGISTLGNFISILHTHDTTGVMHVESATETDYTLGQFFDEWGVKLASDQLGGNKNDGTNMLKVFVDGKQLTTDPRKLVLKAHQEIAVTYGTDAELPNPVPAKYDFPQGE